MRDILTAFPSQALHWVTKSLVGIGESFQKAITASNNSQREPTSSELSISLEVFIDPDYKSYNLLRDRWLYQLIWLQKVLSQYPVSLAALDRMLGKQWTYLLSEGAGFSPFDHYLGLKWLERQLKNTMGVSCTPVLWLHQQAVLEFIREKAENPNDFFHNDLINHLYRYSINQSSYDTIMRLLEFYKPVVSAKLFGAVKKVVTEQLQQVELGSDKDTIAPLIASLNHFFDEAQQLYDLEEVEVKAPMLEQISWAFVQLTKYVRKHPIQSMMFGLTIQASAAAAQDPFLVNTDINGIQGHSSVDAFLTGGFVVGFDSVQFNTSNVFVRAFNNSGIPMYSDFQLSMNGIDNQNPFVKTFSDNTFITAWESGQRVVARRADIFAPIGSEFLLSSSIEVQRNPSIAATLGNEFVATWEQFSAGGWRVFNRRFGSNDLPTGPEVELSSSSTTNPRNPSSATTETDDALVVWEDNFQQEVDYSGSTNIGNMLTGGGLAAAFNGNTNEGLSSAEIRISSSAFVGKDWGAGNEKALTGVRTWGRNDAGYINAVPVITIRVYGSDNNPTSAIDGTELATVIDNQQDTNNVNQQTLLSGFSETDRLYRFNWVGMTSATVDNWWIAELQFFEDIHSIIASLTDGAVASPMPQVNSFSLSIQGDPVAAVFPGSGGEFAVAWNRLGVNGYDVYYQRFSSNGNPITPPVLVHTITANDQRFPSLATFTGGRGFVAFEGEDASGRGISGQFLDESGNRIVNEFPINTDPSGNQEQPVVVRLSDGNLVVTYSGSGLDDSEGVYARIIETRLSATSINQTLSYQENVPVNLAPIMVTAPTFVGDVTITLTLSDVNAGTITTGTAGMVTSTFNTGTGVWQVIGPVNDVNILLSMLEFRPNFGFDNDFEISVNIQDGVNVLNDSIQVVNSPALTTGNPTLTGTNDSSADNDESPPIGLIVGLVFGGLACLGFTACIFFFAVVLARKYQQSHSEDSFDNNIDMSLSSTSASPYKRWNEKSALPSQQISSGNHSLQPTLFESRKIVGGKYDLISKINQEEADELFNQTGVVIKFEPSKKTAKVNLGKKGNFGKLLLARNRKTGKFVFAKKIKGKKAIEQSKDEVEIYKQLKGQPNILPLHDSVEILDGESNPVLYLFMEPAGFGSGEKIRDRFSNLQDSPEIQEKMLAYIARELLIGIRAMHSLKITHKDLKPSNFVIEITGKIWLIDFGCAGPDAITRGDSRYFAPEVLECCRNPQNSYDPFKADAWALGVLLLEILKGKYPFPQGGFRERVEYWDIAFFKEVLENTSELRFDQPELKNILGLIKDLLEVDPDKRISINLAFKHPAIADLQLSAQNYAEILAHLETTQPSVETSAIQHVPRAQDQNYGPEIYHTTNGGVDETETANRQEFYRMAPAIKSQEKEEVSSSSVVLFPMPKSAKNEHYSFIEVVEDEESSSDSNASMG